MALMDRTPLRRARLRQSVLLAYAAFVLVGVAAGGSGVLLLAQMNDYGVDRATIGITFFTVSAGYVLAGLSAGALINRFGIRIALAVGGLTYMLASLYLASRPQFAAFVIVQLVTGFGFGVLESALNVHLAALPGATTMLNRLHAFFGVGALIGPVLAAWIVGFTSWTVVCLILAVACVPLVAGFLVAYPGRQPHEAEPGPDREPDREPAGEASEAARTARAREAARAGEEGKGPGRPVAGGMLAAALRERGVLLGAAMLAVYVGLEIGMGNWGFSYLVQARALRPSIAGYSVSGYWLGLTIGRFVISPVAARMGVSTASMIYACLAGITVTATLAWLSPVAAGASVALMLLGFCLAPIFPTTMAIVPQLTSARLAPTAIGVINAASTVGGAALPWLEGVITQNAGVVMLLPFSVTLALILIAIWWPIARQIRVPAPAPADAVI